MTDLLSLRVRFITESNAMETQMDMISPTPTITIPDPLTPEGYASLCDFLKEAMLHCNRMDEAFSAIQAIYTNSIDPDDLDTMKSRRDDLKRRYHPLNMAVMASATPNHSTFVTDNVNDSMASVGPPTNTITEQRRLREAHAKASVMHDQLLIDVQARAH